MRLLYVIDRRWVMFVRPIPTKNKKWKQNKKPETTQVAHTESFDPAGDKADTTRMQQPPNQHPHPTLECKNTHILVVWDVQESGARQGHHRLGTPQHPLKLILSMWLVGARAKVRVVSAYASKVYHDCVRYAIGPSVPSTLHNWSPIAIFSLPDTMLIFNEFTNHRCSSALKIDVSLLYILPPSNTGSYLTMPRTHLTRRYTVPELLNDVHQQ